MNRPGSLQVAYNLADTLFAATGFDGYGVEGAAVATVISRGLAAVAGLYLLFSGRVGLRPTLGDLRLDPSTVAELLRLGVPLAAGRASGRAASPCSLPSSRLPATTPSRPTASSTDCRR